MIKPTIPKGTRDFSPEQVNKRKYIFRTIENIYRLYGFMPIETPAMENLSTLLGKYGEEGDRLIFRILNNGDFLSRVDNDIIQSKDSTLFASAISEKGLRYDLTVPFARYVVMNRHNITFPFRRYQIQPVWRADRPQKGRYREFYQCDADIIGSDSLLCEMDLLFIIRDVFQSLRIPVITRINHRKVLQGLAEVLDITSQFMDMTISLDKLDKAGWDGVEDELKKRQIPDKAIQRLREIIDWNSLSDYEKLKNLNEIFKDSATGKEGLSDVEYLMNLKGNEEKLFRFDLTLARGLNYYTGIIIEVVAEGIKMGSICGGGRYDNLTGLFGLEGVSGVGISFGADRIYDILESQSLFPENLNIQTQVLLAHFGENTLHEAFRFASWLRQNGISTEIYPHPHKMKKQFAYADKLNIPWVVIIGEDELKQGMYGLKNMHSGEQKTLSASEVLSTIKKSG